MKHVPGRIVSTHVVPIHSADTHVLPVSHGGRHCATDVPTMTIITSSSICIMKDDTLPVINQYETSIKYTNIRERMTSVFDAVRATRVMKRRDVQDVVRIIT